MAPKPPRGRSELTIRLTPGGWGTIVDCLSKKRAIANEATLVWFETPTEARSAP